MSMALAIVRNKPLYERRLKGAWAGYEVARRVSNILKTKKAEGKQVDTAIGPFAGGSSYLTSPKADRMYEQLISFIERFDETEDAVFDQNRDLRPNSSVSTNAPNDYMKADVMNKHIYRWRGHEATTVLKDC